MSNEDYLDGYDAGWEFHMGCGQKIEPSDAVWRDDQRLADWQRGFDDAGDDS